MKATVISIGDEILIGQTVNTNSAWMGQQLSLLGIRVHEVICCSDNAAHIVSSLRRAEQQSEIVLMTGGLGPTKDDITKKTLVDYFETELELNEAVWERMKQIFEKRGLQVLEMNRSQAMIPKASTMLPNQRGTAQGMWFEKNGVVYVSMPGVPHEMKHLMENEVLPRLKQRFHFPAVFHETVMTAGAGESVVATRLNDFENRLPDNIKLAYLPELGVVKLRLTATGLSSDLQDSVQAAKKNLISELGDLYYADGEMRLEQAVGNLLLNQKATLSCAESCTGGFISHLMTSVPGSSAYFDGSIISYSYAVKEHMLGVKQSTLEAQGAVSEACVREMVAGLLKQTRTTYGIAVSGIAGPGGGTEDKPVGTVWIAVANAERIVARQFRFFPSRMENIRVFSHAALNMLRLFMDGKLR